MPFHYDAICLSPRVCRLLSVNNKEDASPPTMFVLWILGIFFIIELKLLGVEKH